MRVAIIGSRNLRIENIEKYIPDECGEIVTGGARGIDTCAAEYARSKGIKLTEFLPDYRRYGRGAPIIRNREIIEYAQRVVVIWDGRSRGSDNVIKECTKRGVDVRVFLINKEE